MSSSLNNIVILIYYNKIVLLLFFFFLASKNTYGSANDYRQIIIYCLMLIIIIKTTRFKYIGIFNISCWFLIANIESVIDLISIYRLGWFRKKKPYGITSNNIIIILILLFKVIGPLPHHLLLLCLLRHTAYRKL